MNVISVTLPPKERFRESTRIAIWIIISLIVMDVILTWLYYYSGLPAFWVVFIMNQIWFTLAITNYQALFLVPWTYRRNEVYFENTKKASIIIGAIFNESERRGISAEMMVDRVVGLFEFADENKEELEFFYNCIINPIKTRIEDMTPEQRREMIRKIAIGVNYYLDDVESLAAMSDSEVKQVLRIAKRKSLKDD